jgi:uracil-DNA glycosylase
MTRKIYGPFTPYDQLRDRVMELWIRGVRHLPLPKEGWESSSGDPAILPVSEHQSRAHESQEGEPDRVADPDRLLELKSCRRCPICPPPSGSGVYHTPLAQSGRTGVPFLVVLDQPFESDSLSGDLAAERSPNHLIQRLLTRAGILRQTHVVYALRSRLMQAPQDKWVKVCAQHWLLAEIEVLVPQVILVFGARACLAVQFLFPDPLLAVEQGGEAIVHHRGRPIRVVMLPSSLELQFFPSWRQGVWEKVSLLAGKGSAHVGD